MTLVVDAALVVSALVDGGAEGQWAEEQLAAGQLAAPHLMLVEAADILRRATLAGTLPTQITSLAHADLLDLRVELFPYAPLGDRVWELRQNMTSYDAWYVALAEHLDAPLATLDAKLAHSTGPRCAFVTPRRG
ncbi:putative nucleic acid-binding protein [Haloactinopolyspora alba]|uniref:Ribonuclease VapC n=1 Tax=Haloactinopolyspora alba TaxID=648780 RepID=A0A2P8D5B4_9ACTN|nr:type II toxin-antitoxin system VapC family toxin [Haloactinopolyspora alba]PSK92407.1 putative nucleic acid-binding protein [Haloactinopolyspora alba]